MDDQNNNPGGTNPSDPNAPVSQNPNPAEPQQMPGAMPPAEEPQNEVPTAPVGDQPTADQGVPQPQPEDNGSEQGGGAPVV